MRKIILFILVILSGLTTYAIPKIAIYGFENKTIDSVFNSENIFRGYTKYLESELFASGKFSILERQSLDKIVEEQKLNLSGLLDDNSRAVELGKLSGAEYLVLAGVDKLPDGYMVNIKILDVNTGIVAFTEAGKIINAAELERKISDIVSKVTVEGNKITKMGLILKDSSAVIQNGSDVKKNDKPNANSNENGHKNVSFIPLALTLKTINAGIEFPLKKDAIELTFHQSSSSSSDYSKIESLVVGGRYTKYSGDDLTGFFYNYNGGIVLGQYENRSMNYTNNLRGITAGIQAGLKFGIFGIYVTNSIGLNYVVKLYENPVGYPQAVDFDGLKLSLDFLKLHFPI